MTISGMLGRCAALSALAASQVHAYTETSGGYNLPTGATEIAREVYGLHMAIFWVCVVIALVVFGAMFYSVYAHRKSKGHKPADFHESTTVEIIWTIIPFIILIGMAIPAAGTLIKMEDTRNADMSIKITGYQWMWEYEYVGEPVKFFSKLSEESNRARQLKSGIDPNAVPNYLVDVDKPLVVPVGKKIRFLITANDVIHAWWVPELAVKKDAIPGYINEAWAKIDRPGIYRGVCAELCGRDHGFMPIVVKAVSEEEYKVWLAEQSGAPAPAPALEVAAAAPTPVAEPAPAAPAVKAVSKDELMQVGQGIYQANCAACHQASGAGLPPNFPSLIGSALVLGEPATQIAQVLAGKGLMPPFPHLSDADIAAVVTYTRNSWGNNSGVVQPADVAAAR